LRRIFLAPAAVAFFGGIGFLFLDWEEEVAT
jgi:hypothetical protein